MTLRPLPQLLHRSPPAATGRRALSVYSPRVVRAFGAERGVKYHDQHEAIRFGNH
ncbi:MAG: hypothetical protein KME11_02830 [Timaviella obliquedivisa GSE-PSE-MK23-08B]|nr:hypothetical protein [Timaviella obliquedivisa GSE-PSE-MK23-08B]